MNSRMKLRHAYLFLFALKLTGVPLVVAVGRVPNGKFNSPKFHFNDLEEPLDLCSRAISCAGITYHPHEEEWDVHFHSFLPPLLNNSKEHDWTTERSNKSFVLHPGKLVSSDALLQLDNMDPSTLSLDQVEELCKDHPECVAFSYPIDATNLDGFSEILFARSIQNITMEDDIADEWNTLVINDEDKAGKANADAMVYFEELEDQPYSTCCQRVPSVARVDLPSIEEVEQMDTLPRISCSISKVDFQAQYEFTRTPVILEGCETDWPATTEWTYEKLTKRFAHDNTTTWRTKRHNVPGEWDDDFTWEEIDELRGHNNGVYIFDPLESPGKSSILEEYSTPLPMNGTDYFADDFPPDWGARRWLCVGERGSGSDPHMDPFSTDAWNTLINGHKWWILFPKGVEIAAVECDPFCSTPNPEAIDWYTSIGRNAARTSFADGSKPFHILQKPGETLYVPNGYIHSVMNLDETIAITANYGSPGNVLKVWEAAVRKGSIDHWVSMFEERFSDKEREAVMQGEIWPPYLFAGIDPESEDLVFNYGEGAYDEAAISWDNNEEGENDDDEEVEDDGNEGVEANDEL